jgi:hypothetical protein
MVTTTSKDAGHRERQDAITTSQAPNYQHPSTNRRRPSVQYTHTPENEQAITSESESEDDGVNNDEYDFVERDVQESSGIRPTPTYHYPDTWSTALTHTSTAFSCVTTSTSSYLHSLTHSGVAKAGLAISGALAATANRTALGVASKAVGSAGVEKRLPTGVRCWLKGKEKLDEQRRRAETKEGERKARKMKMELGERSELIGVVPGWYHDPKASKSRTVSMVSHRRSGNSRGDEHEEGDMVGGQRGSSTRRRSTPSGLRGELAKFRIVEESRDEEREGVRIKSPLLNQNPWIGNSKSNSPIISPPLSSSPGFERVQVQIDTPAPLLISSTDASLFLGQCLVESPFFYHDSDDKRTSHHRDQPQLSFQEAPDQKKDHGREKANETKEDESEQEDDSSDDEENNGKHNEDTESSSEATNFSK